MVFFELKFLNKGEDAVVIFNQKWDILVVGKMLGSCKVYTHIYMT